MENLFLEQFYKTHKFDRQGSSAIVGNIYIDDECRVFLRLQTRGGRFLRFPEGKLKTEDNIPLGKVHDLNLRLEPIVVWDSVMNQSYCLQIKAEVSSQSLLVSVEMVSPDRRASCRERV